MKAVEFTLQEKADFYSEVVNVILTQISAYKGIKLHSEKAIAALFKEFTQLDKGAHDGKRVIGPIALEELSDKDKAEALEAVNLIKVKRDGSIKGVPARMAKSRGSTFRRMIVSHHQPCLMKV